MADFTGFYFNNIHSSTYGLIRTSDGDRYEDGLIPEFDDYDIECVGRDGDLYEGRRYKKTEFTIKVAFDHMTETQLRGLRQWLGEEELKEFRFDERPYKAYWVKVASRPKLDYLCFLEEKDDAANKFDTERIYKGEGEISFIAYDPFGYCCDNTYELSLLGKKENIDGVNWQQVKGTYKPYTIKDMNSVEWAESSGLKNELITEDDISYNDFFPVKNPDYCVYEAILYNPGDFEADFQLFIELDSIPHRNSGLQFTIYKEVEKNGDKKEEVLYFFKVKVGTLSSGTLLLFDTKKHSFTIGKAGVDDNDETCIVEKSLRYDLVQSATWPKVPKGETFIRVSSSSTYYTPSIKYNYKYY